MATRNFSDYDRSKVPNAEKMCFGIVVSERNSEITSALLEGAVKTLESYDALPENIHVKRVPGTFELVYGAHQMTLNDGYDAVIALGAGMNHMTAEARLHQIVAERIIYFGKAQNGGDNFCSTHFVII